MNTSVVSPFALCFNPLSHRPPPAPRPVRPCVLDSPVASSPAVCVLREGEGGRGGRAAEVQAVAATCSFWRGPAEQRLRRLRKIRTNTLIHTQSSVPLRNVTSSQPCQHLHTENLAFVIIVSSTNFKNNSKKNYEYVD